MITRLFMILILTFFIQSCDADVKSITTENAASNVVVSNSASAENIINDLSNALTKKDLTLLLSIADPKEIYLVRQFTSGNLGGRGASLSEAMATSKINKDLAFEIKKQTPFELPGLFISLPIKSAKALSHRTLASESEYTHFDKWEPILKKSLKGATEATKGDPILLVSNSSKYWVYAEAQIIDDILVGGFAVFRMQDEKIKLVSVIELL